MKKTLLYAVFFSMATFGTAGAQDVYQRQMDNAIENNDIKAAQEMLEKGAYISDIPQYMLVQKKLPTIKFLLDNGYEIFKTAELYSDLFNLSSSDNFNKVKLFLDHRLSPYGHNEYNQTTLFDVTETLLGVRAIGSSPKVTPDTEKAYKYFVSQAAKDLNTLSPGGGLNHEHQCRPIDVVYGLYKSRMPNAAKWLIEAGTDVNQCSGIQNFTPLMTAVNYGDKDMVAYILSRKDVNINAVCGRFTALGLVQNKKSHAQNMIDIELMLLDKGAK